MIIKTLLDIDQYRSSLLSQSDCECMSSSTRYVHNAAIFFVCQVDLCENPIIEYVNSKPYIVLLINVSNHANFLCKILVIVPHQCVYFSRKLSVCILGRSFM